MTGVSRPTEVARVEPVPSGAGSTLRAWADEAVAAAHIARSLALTPFVPDSLRARVPNDPDEELRRTTANVGAALLVGQEVGLGPMAALRSIDVVNGTPALRAIALRAIVQSHGHHIYIIESTQTRAIVGGRRFGTEPEQRAVWTIDRARQLGLVARDQWRKQPTAMLVARATAECARLIASDAILGLGYVAEELRDGPEQAETIEQAASTARTMRRASAAPVTPAQADPPPAAIAPVSAPEPPEDDPSTDEPEQAPEPASVPVGLVDVPLPPMPPDAPPPPPVLATPPRPEPPPPPPASPLDNAKRPMNAAQRRALFAMLNSLGITIDDDRHAKASAILGRTVESFSSVTDSEAHDLLNALHAEELNMMAKELEPPEPEWDEPELFEELP